MTVSLVAKFPHPHSLIAKPDLLGSGMGEALPAHLAVAGHILVNLSPMEMEEFKSQGETEEPMVVCMFPNAGEAGMDLSWSNLASPQEQLALLGHFYLALAESMWLMSIQSQHKLIVPDQRPRPGFGPPGFPPGLFPRG